MVKRKGWARPEGKGREQWKRGAGFEIEVKVEAGA